VQGVSYKLADYVDQMNPDLLSKLKYEKKFTDEIRAELKEEVENFFQQYSH